MSRFLVTYHGSGMPDDPALMEQAKAGFGNWVAGPYVARGGTLQVDQIIDV
jgi:hypothetical protein